MSLSFVDAYISCFITGLGSYMAAGDFTTLASMYTLFSRVGGITVLCAAFRQHIRVGFFAFLPPRPDYDVYYLDIGGGNRQGC